MKDSEIDDCVRAYCDGIDAYLDLEKSLKAAAVAAANVPLRIPSVLAARENLAAAKSPLKQLADSLTFLPKLVGQLRKERILSKAVRSQALAKGVALRYEDAEDETDLSDGDTD